MLMLKLHVSRDSRVTARDIKYEIRSREITLNAILIYGDLSAAGETKGCATGHRGSPINC